MTFNNDMTRPLANLAPDAQEDINFLLTNRIPRRLADPVHGLVQPDRAPAGCAAVDRPVAAVFRSRPERRQEDAISAACTTASRASSRPARARSMPTPAILVSPCDAIVGACGAIDGDRCCQAKGFPYTLDELLGETSWSRARTATAAT